ncbi:diadenylate cyclase [Rossellomorea sp. KS-H15a]|uniref:diadenylate cyclase n=1 Tax=Rossellomorea sp. KS-H15a TaxID=2963940 RepID=UPI0020C66B7A|nr:diadenylate cyclase [Rossellomorea sp. KS-H15a]UTE77218.1 diadenylate cyclase [Rossellomorea sp. KS-H15a]
MPIDQTFINDYKSSLEDYLGLEFDIEIDNSEGATAFAVEINNIDEEVLSVNEELINSTITDMLNSLLTFYSSHKDLKFKPIYSSVLIEELVHNTIDNSSNVQLANFLEDLKRISVKTYETESTSMGFIVIKEDLNNIKDVLANLDIEFIDYNSAFNIREVEKDKQVFKLVDSLSLVYVVNHNYEIIGLGKKMKGKKSIFDIMMNRHRKHDELLLKYSAYSYFISNSNANLEGEEKLKKWKNTLTKLETYILEKVNQFNNSYNDISDLIDDFHDGKLDEKSYESIRKELEIYLIYFNKTELRRIGALEEINSFLSDLKDFTDRDRNNLKLRNIIDFVYIKDKQLNWSITPNLIINFNNGKWKLKNYAILSNIIANYIIRQYSPKNLPYDKEIRSLLRTISFSISRVLDLFSSIKSLSSQNKGALIVLLNRTTSNKSTIYKGLLKEGKLTTGDNNRIIQTPSSNPINIRSCDSYMFELLASIDGAILLDSYFNLLSYGEIINNNINQANSKIQFRGARTTAAMNASKFGLAIKVSEDGDISVFEDGTLLMTI